ncbi:MAG: hypothetical protein HY017_10170 [Betaproteobacteria bacterium]|nr:hypothetical protein [Betaproteobacteria bacterium]
MQGYAIGFFIAALSSACFIDATADVAKLGKIGTVLFTVLFIVTEGIALIA